MQRRNPTIDCPATAHYVWGVGRKLVLVLRPWPQDGWEIRKHRHSRTQNCQGFQMLLPTPPLYHQLFTTPRDFDLLKLILLKFVRLGFRCLDFDSYGFDARHLRVKLTHPRSSDMRERLSRRGPIRIRTRVDVDLEGSGSAKKLETSHAGNTNDSGLGFVSQ